MESKDYETELFRVLREEQTAQKQHRYILIVLLSGILFLTIGAMIISTMVIIRLSG